MPNLDSRLQPTAGPDDALADRLDAAWDALVLGAATPQSGLDPASAALIARLHALPAAPAADHARERVWRRVADRRPIANTREVSAVPGTGTWSLGAARPRAGNRTALSRWWPPIEYAVAALVIVGLMGGLLGAGWLRGDDGPENRGAAGGGDWAEFGSGTRVEVDPDATMFHVAVRRITVAPGARFDLPPEAVEADIENLVLDGTLAFGSANPGVPETVERRGNGLRIARLATIRNDGDEPATVVQMVLGAPWPETPAPQGVTIELLAETSYDRLGGEAVTVFLSRIEVPDEGVGEVEPLRGGLALVAVESGAVNLTAEGGNVAALPGIRPDPAATPRSVPPAVVDEGRLRLISGEAVAITGGGEFTVEPVDGERPYVVLASIVPDLRGERAFPGVGGAYAVPDNGDPIGFGVIRYTLPPGASVARPFTGTALHLIESGEVAVSFGADPAPEVSLFEDGKHNASGSGTLTVRNTGDRPAVVVQGLVAAPDYFGDTYPPFFVGEVQTAELGFGSGQLPPGAASVVLIPEGTDGQGAGGSASGGDGFDLVVVDAGRMIVTEISGAVEVLRPGATEPQPLDAGAEGMLAVGDAAIVRPGSSWGQLPHLRAGGRPLAGGPRAGQLRPLAPIRRQPAAMADRGHARAIGGCAPRHGASPPPVMLRLRSISCRGSVVRLATTTNEILRERRMTIE